MSRDKYIDGDDLTLEGSGSISRVFVTDTIFPPQFFKKNNLIGPYFTVTSENIKYRTDVVYH